MAETNNKRNSATGKVATPKAVSAATPGSTSSSPQPMQPSRDILTTPVGARVKITTAHQDNKTHEGVIYAIDRKLKLIAINCTPAPPNPSTSLASVLGDYHVFGINNIQNFQLLSKPEGDNATSDSKKDNDVPVVSQQELARLREREQKAVQKLKDEERKKGKGVSLETQELFNGIERMYTNQTRWDGQSIIVMDAVRLDPPYGPEDLKAPKDKAHMLPMLRKVVDGERKKIANRVATPPISGRKGG